ncbi:MAG: hypothetical protein EAZ85_05160 [Bacteroidetes bacterium]|nr:MAG: hypothetical protein EAZ85_05160 [Bacteroidota bacterium]TAG86305.1 MAG: hypothetical protein EAZ20_13060 [Bacteroidota bacterium]
MLFIVIALLVFITQSLFTDFWLSAASAFIASFLLGKNNLHSFLSGFCGVGVIWLGYILFIDTQNESLLADRIAQLFKLSSGTWLIVVTTCLGGITGGLSAWTGYALKSLFISKK